MIKEWNHNYYNGTGTQGLGSYRVMVDAAGKPYRYFGPDHADNYLPDGLAHSEAQKYGKINTIDNYLTVDSYFAVKGADTENDQVWRSVLFYYVDPQEGAANQTYLDYMRANGFDGNSDDEVRAKIIAGDTAAVTKLTDAYISAQPGYSAATDPHGIMRFNKEDNSGFNKDVLQYEFLVGTDIDNSNPTVQAEQVNWAKFLTCTEKMHQSWVGRSAIRLGKGGLRVGQQVDLFVTNTGANCRVRKTIRDLRSEDD